MINLNETWKLCLSMWRWIAEERKKDNTRSVEDLKDEWLEKHGFKSIANNCFFCEYAYSHKTVFRRDAECPCCPGTEIDPDFYCQNRDYHYCREPIAFYNKLRSLNRKRKTNDR